MLSALFLLLLLLVSLPAGNRSHATARISNNHPDRHITYSDSLIFGSDCSGCYFDSASASRSLFEANSILSSVYSISDDLTRPYDLIIYVKF